MFVEGSNGQAKITDISAETMETILSFIYEGKVDADKINADLLFGADKYNLQGLFEMCVSHFLDNFKVDNVMELIETASLVPNSQDLFTAALKFALKDRTKLSKIDLKLPQSKWDEFSKEHSDTALKILTELMFNPSTD